MSKNLKIKIGVEIDSTKTKMELEKTLQSLQKNKVKIGFEVDTKSLNALKKTLDSFKNIKINIGTNGNTDSVKGVSNSVKETNKALNEQKQLYSQLKQLQNEEYAIKKKLVTADGESKKVLTENLAVVKQQQTAIQNKISASSKGLSNDQKELQLAEQKLRKERELAQAKAKTNTEMQKAITNAQNNMNTKGFNTKQIEEYRRQLEAIDRTNMSNVRREIESIGRSMDDQRNAMKNFGDEVMNIGSAMQSAGTAILEVFALPMAGIMYATETMKEYTYEMDRVQAVSSATVEEMAQLDAMTKELGRTTVWSATESAQALSYMGMAGWDSQEMLSGLPNILSLATASGEGLSRTSDIVTDALTAFKLEASDTGHFVDVLAQSASASNTTVGMMGESFSVTCC